MKKHKKRPIVIEWILKRIPDFNKDFDVAEDLRESYISTVQNKGQFKSYLWFLHQVFFKRLQEFLLSDDSTACDEIPQTAIQIRLN